MLPILAQTGWDRPGSHAGFWRSPGASHSSLWSWARWRWKGQLAQGLSAFPVRIHSFLLSTYFGKEAEVAAHTHLDSHRVEKPRNHWVLVTGSPRQDSPTMLHLPKPPVENTCALEQAADPEAQ